MQKYNIFGRDYKQHTQQPIITGMGTKHMHWLIPTLGVLTSIGLFIVMPTSSEATRSPLPQAHAPASAADATGKLTLPLNLPEHRDSGESPQHGGDDAAATRADPWEDIEQANWETVTVRPGDNLAAIFSRLGLSARTLHDIVALGDETKRLKRLYPGDTVKISQDSSGRLQDLLYEIDVAHTLKVSRNGSDTFTAEMIQRALESRSAHARGVIESSFYLAGKEAGLSDKLIMELAGIFGWDIDFVLDIRAGDSFTVLYEQNYLDGEKVDDGPILVAEFVNQGRTFRAVRYETANNHINYYAPDGKSMRKAFLRSPVEFTRISSRFNPGRRHPILNRIRAHKGVDYAAPRGTPVRATGDGKVVFRGRNGGYGNVIKLQHGQRYHTVYAHLSGYARAARRNRHVRQGQIIGYVGSTGLATGPHLHYEFRVNGVHRNPLTVDLPDASPIAAKYKSDFFATTRPLIAQLETLKNTTVVLNQE